MRFIRYGGLSPVDYKKKDPESFSNEFHAPPVRRGIYAFIAPYEEVFLWHWKINSVKYDDEKKQRQYDKMRTRQLRREFEYSGNIWCHFTEVICGDKSGSWVLTNTDNLEEALRKITHNDTKALKERCLADKIINPYVRGLGGYMSRDHLEVFIDAKHLGRIG